MNIETLYITDLIINRRSPVTFSDKLIPQEKLDLLFDAARWAPSSYNLQPWRFIYAKKDNPEEYNVLFDCLLEGNKTWAKQAPVLALSIAEVTSPYNEKNNYYAFYDTGMAVGNLLAQATSLKLYVHQMGGYDKIQAKAKLGIPSGYEPAAMMAIGYLGDINSLSEELKKRETTKRIRKPIAEIAFQGKWKDNL